MSERTGGMVGVVEHKAFRHMLNLVLWWKIRGRRRRARLGRMIMHLRRAREAEAPDSFELLTEPAALQGMAVGELVGHFKALAIAKDEAEGMPESERLYWQLDAVICELERRPGDERHALLALYTDPDIRIRAEAADATRTLAPDLSRDRLLAIDDPDWSPPTSGKPRQSRLQGTSTEQLVERFTALGLEQDDALLNDKIPKYNRLFWLVKAVEAELATRVGDQRRALLALLYHPNPQVRLTAAFATLRVDPAAARAALQAIVDRDEYPQTADASGMLRSLDERR